MDSGTFGQEDAAAAREFLKKFDEVFAVIADNDAEKLKELGFGGDGDGLSESEIEALIAERQAARQRRDFAKSDEVRKKLAESSIILEDSKDGTVRWKRK
jgi:cysteinyl-tRNA synthetase